VTKGHAPKTRPRNTPDGKTKAGDVALSRLLRTDIDGRYKIAKDRDKLEAELVDYAGGLDRLSPPMLILIQRITSKTLVAQQREKMALAGEVDLEAKEYLALSNSLRLDVMALQALLRDRVRVEGDDLETIIAKARRVA
jgi:hypothetical protein